MRAVWTVIFAEVVEHTSLSCPTNKQNNSINKKSPHTSLYFTVFDEDVCLWSAVVGSQCSHARSGFDAAGAELTTLNLQNAHS